MRSLLKDGPESRQDEGRQIQDVVGVDVGDALCLVALQLDSIIHGQRSARRLAVVPLIGFETERRNRIRRCRTRSNLLHAACHLYFIPGLNA
jgi:hypothetical protein